MDLGVFRSGSLVSSTRGQTNSAPTNPQIASAVRASTPQPIGLDSANKFGEGIRGTPAAKIAIRLTARSARTMIKANADCSLAKTSTPRMFMAVKKAMIANAETIGGSRPGKSSARTRSIRTSSAERANMATTTYPANTASIAGK